MERGTLTVGVSESGTLEYGITSLLYDLDLDVSDEDEEDSDEDSDETDSDETVQKYLKIEKNLCSLRQRIEEGDALIKLTEDSVSDVRRLLESAVVDARSAYNEAEAEYNLSVLEAQTTYDTQLVESEYAASIYSSKSQSVTNDIEAIQVEINQRNANISLLEEALEQAKEDYAEALETYESACQSLEAADIDHTENFMTYQNAMSAPRTQYQNAKTALEQAQQNLEDNTEEIASLEEQLANAQAKSAIDMLDAKEAYEEALIEGDNEHAI